MPEHHGTDPDAFVFTRHDRADLPEPHSAQWRKAGACQRTIKVNGRRHQVFDDNGLMSLDAISAIWEYRGEGRLSREYVRQIIDQALLKIRAALEESDRDTMIGVDHDA